MSGYLFSQWLQLLGHLAEFWTYRSRPTFCVFGEIQHVRCSQLCNPIPMRARGWGYQLWYWRMQKGTTVSNSCRQYYFHSSVSTQYSTTLYCEQRREIQKVERATVHQTTAVEISTPCQWNKSYLLWKASLVLRYLHSRINRATVYRILGKPLRWLLLCTTVQYLLVHCCSVEQWRHACSLLCSQTTRITQRCKAFAESDQWWWSSSCCYSRPSLASHFLHLAGWEPREENQCMNTPFTLIIL